jgi:hypothetical protein
VSQLKRFYFVYLSTLINKTLCYFTAKVAVRPFLKKYLGKHHQVEPFVISTENAYGMLLYSFLERPKLKIVRDVPDEDFAIDKKIYSETLLVKIGEKYWNHRGCVLSPQSQLHFNKFVLQNFNEEFYKYVKHRIGPKGTINKSIRDFVDMYDITEDDLSFRTIQRAFQRRNAKMKASIAS